MNEGSNIGKKRKVLGSSSVNQGNVKKAKGESSQQTSEPAPDTGLFEIYLVYN
jgi:hypothetical protein